MVYNTQDLERIKAGDLNIYGEVSFVYNQKEVFVADSRISERTHLSFEGPNLNTEMTYKVEDGGVVIMRAGYLPKATYTYGITL